MRNIFGYQERATVIHQLNGVAKLSYFLVTTLAVMMTYDMRLMLVMSVVSWVALVLAKVQWRDVKVAVSVLAFFAVLNLVTIYLLTPQYGEQLYGSRHVLFGDVGRYSVTAEQLFYEFNLFVKYMAIIPLVLLFVLTMHPSEFAASFHRIGVPYRIAYAFSLTLRYIPDIQRDFINIRNAQLARSGGQQGKQSLMAKIKQAVQLAFPLILMSFERIDTISQAMMLRRFGERKGRTWYVTKPMTMRDWSVIGIALIWIVVVIALLFVNQGRYYNPFI